MGFKCGIIGLPNVGKSTIFNALTKANAKIANFPFCTIKPNIGIVYVPDLRINQLAEIVKPQSIIPTTMKFVDIAGLVKGASKGEGLGNKFLINIRETEAICHVVRCFEKQDIVHIDGKVDPAKDIDIINTELILFDLAICEKAIKKIKNNKNKHDKYIECKFSLLEKCLFHLNSYRMLRTLNISEKEKNIIKYNNFLTLKPTMYIANVNEYGFKNNSYLDIVRDIALLEKSPVITICATKELESASIEDQYKFIVKLDIENNALSRIIYTGYTILNLQTYFTVGKKEVRAWTIPFGTTALQAARKIHTDLEKGFICAQIVSFVDFITYNGVENAKKSGKMRFEGKKYIVQNGDIINFLFNV